MARPERQEAVLNLLKDLRSIEPLKQLFWSELNYERVNQSLSRRGWSDTASKALADDPILFASGGQDSGFHVIYSRLASDALLLGHERPVVSKILQDHPYALFIFSDKSQNRWHFLNVKYDEQSTKRRLFRRITVGPEERLRTASERISLLDLSSISPDLFGLSPLTIQSAHDSAFDVEAVTKQFFEEYKAVYRILEDDLKRQTKDGRWAHDYALQFLNRIMFLYFVQRKRWLGDDTEFLRSLWEAYRVSKQTNDSFFDRWLKVLFFEAFNNKFHGGHRHFPEKIRNALFMAPYLNGGLFKDNELDDRNFTITDAQFKQVFTFLERYNFTIAEDSPIDQEVAVDPEMIGKVYESLVNVSTETDERGDAGIFYTPRTEIDLMCRLSLVDYLASHLGSEHKSLLYEVVFAMEQDEKEAADKALAKAGLWQKLSALLREITALDPACGSGSFIVGMLHILDDLQKRANLQLKIEETGFERKKRIIGQSLYGVDVMKWACHVAELRLWLALVIDAEFTREELHVRQEPLLPHFTFKIRCGDSLVQEVGGINFGHIHASKGLTGDLKARITTLKNEKMKFYNNDPKCQFKSDKALKNAELKLFKDILSAQSIRNSEKIKELKTKIERQEWKAVSLLDGTVEQKSQQLRLDEVKYRKEIEELTVMQEKLSRAHAALKNSTDIPFIWDIAFVEVFEGEKEGFDIVIGNPPYVRQENISDPHLGREEVTTENKKEYKAKLIRSVYQAFDRFFGYQPKNDSDPLKPEKAIAKKLDAKSDLYIYFYFHGLSLLNEKGAFCFITSNSWLDVGYGADLQEFLLKHCHVKMVIDNQVKRSFASADVNTVIALFSVPDETKEWGLDKTARFIMFKVPFEHILSPVIFEEIENAKERAVSKEYRVYPLAQEKLLEDGCEMPEEDSEEPQKKKGKVAPGLLIKSAKYVGNKWGGKYLRAPDIYWTILSKGKFLVQDLSGYFEGERYLNTGGADGFFIVTKANKTSSGIYNIYNDNITDSNGQPFEGEIEEDYLIPLIKDFTKNNKSIEIKGYDAYCLVIKDSPSTRVKKYIRWGEEQGYHQRSVTKNQRPWYKPTNQMISSAKILVPRSFSDSFVIYYNPKAYLSLRFYRLHLKHGKPKELVGFLNSTLVALFLETLGNKALGLGVLDFFMADFLKMKIPVVLNKDVEVALNSIKDRQIQNIWTEYGFLPANLKKHITPIQDRKTLDDIIFDKLRLTQGEKEAVYEAVIQMTETRLKKAESLNQK